MGEFKRVVKEKENREDKRGIYTAQSYYGNFLQFLNCLV